MPQKTVSLYHYTGAPEDRYPIFETIYDLPDDYNLKTIQEDVYKLLGDLEPADRDNYTIQIRNLAGSPRKALEEVLAEAILVNQDELLG